jgi:hypothetical protein
MTDITISAPLMHGEREITCGRAVAYGIVADDGETYHLNHAPTQMDFDAVSAALASLTAAEIAELVAQAGVQ